MAGTLPSTLMKKDWSISLFPSGSTRLNLNERLPPFSPFSWLYCSKPAKWRKTFIGYYDYNMIRYYNNETSKSKRKWNCKGWLLWVVSKGNICVSIIKELEGMPIVMRKMQKKQTKSIWKFATAMFPFRNHDPIIHRPVVSSFMSLHNTKGSVYLQLSYRMIRNKLMFLVIWVLQAKCHLVLLRLM